MWAVTFTHKFPSRMVTFIKLRGELCLVWCVSTRKFNHLPSNNTTGLLLIFQRSFTSIVLFGPQINPKRVLSLPSFYWWGTEMRVLVVTTWTSAEMSLEQDCLWWPRGWWWWWRLPAAECTLGAEQLSCLSRLMRTRWFVFFSCPEPI